MHCHLGAAIALCVVAVFSPGCGKSTTIVRGTVTYNNAPLTTGEVHFMGSSGPSRSALIGPDGTFTVENCPLGEVKVAVVSIKTSGKAPSGPTVGVASAGGLQAEGSAIPRKYNDAATSGLVYTISGGSQTINIALKD